jgi:hypothetical protein
MESGGEIYTMDLTAKSNNFTNDDDAWWLYVIGSVCDI